MDIKGALTRKLGPLPMWVYLLLLVAGGWYLYTRRFASTDEGADPNAVGPGGGPSAASADQGSFTSTNTATGGDGTTATQTASGPLLTGGFVGNPLGYPGYNDPGNTYINVPGSPQQITTIHHRPTPGQPPPAWRPHQGQGQR